MKNSNWINIVSIIVAVMLGVGSTYAMLIKADTGTNTKLENIEKVIEKVPNIINECNLNKQKIEYHGVLVNKEMDSLKETTGQLQKTTNILTVQVSEIAEANHKILSVLENLNTSINGLNTTIARFDERLKNIERQQ
jgi:long-subunit acyl-CoA synthetase (AMP-forming)